MASALPQPETIITHESDLDGLLSGLLLQKLARHLFQTDIQLQAYNYASLRNRQFNEVSAWISDLSVEPRMDKPAWMVVDHHVFDHPVKHARLVHDLKKSAALLCYDLCREHGLSNDKLDRLVHLNNVADLFLENDPDFIEANDYASLVKVYGFWNLLSLIEGEPERLLDHPLLGVMQAKREIEDPIGLEWSRANLLEITPEIGLVRTTVGNVNLIVHSLLEENSTRYKILLTLIRRSNGVVNISLRSRNNEAIEIARKFQGGGHANACGATLPRSVKNIANAITYLKQVLNPEPQPAPSINSLESLFDAVDTRKNPEE